MTNALTPRASAARLSLTLIAVAVLAGCAVTPPAPLATDDMVRQADADRRAIFAAQEPVQGAISLDEAVARALKYNLKQRLALMERALEDRLVDVQQQGMLPKLAASAGLRTRSNENGSSSRSLSTGAESLVTSTSQERSGETANLQLSWNVLDFGLSYFGAKAQMNKVMAAEERRRRVVADIVRETRAAYWSAVTAERLQQRVADTLVQANQMLAQARQAGQQRLMTPVAALRYQRDLLNMVRQTEQLANDLAQAKTRLAVLMNLPPATAYTLAAPDSATLTPPPLAYALGDLEALAMVQRPELREEGYQARNALLETRMALMRLFPNVALFGGLNYDSNKYLAHQGWADAGVQVSGNLLNLLAMPAIERSAQAREQVAELRRQALRMTVLTQVHVAWLERERAQHAFQRAQELSGLQDAIQQQTENAAQARSETPLELVRARVETLLAQRARDLSYAELVNAHNTIYQAAGLDTLPDVAADSSVAGLARLIAQGNQRVEKGEVAVPRLTVLAAADMAKPGDPARAVAAQPAAVPQPAAPSPVLRVLGGDRWSSLGSLEAVQP